MNHLKLKLLLFLLSVCILSYGQKLIPDYALNSSRPVSSQGTLSIDNVLEINRNDLYLAQAARYIHNELILPTTCTYGTVKWIFTPLAAKGKGSLTFENGTFRVTSRAKTATTVGRLQGKITYSGKNYNLFKTPLTVKVAPDDNAYGYLYCHMPNLVPEPGVGTSVSQCITYALGTKQDKGLIYTELNRGSAIINGIGTTLPWCRDGFIAKDTLRKCYYMVTTDLFGSLENGTSMLMNYSVGMFKSYDLIKWSYSRCDIKNYLKQNPVTDIYNNAATSLLTSDKVSRVWAPQIIFIDNNPYIYYAVGNSDNGNCDHFYISKANNDFTSIESFKMLYGNNKVDNVLDADIVFLETDNLYHMFLRDYAADYMCDITTKDLLNPSWSKPVTTYTDGGGYEASSVFRRINEDVWNVGNVNYASNIGFHFRTADACLRNFKSAPDLTGHVSPQHGSFIHINKTEYELLQVWSDLKALIADAKELNIMVSSNLLGDIIAKSEADISNRKKSAVNLDSLCNVLTADFESLSARFKFESALQQANNANVAYAATHAGKMDNKFNNGALTVAIENAKSKNNSTDNTMLINEANNLTTAITNYFRALKSKGTPVSVVNGMFNSGNSGWNNNSTSVAFNNSNGVSEFFALRATNHTVNLTQTLTNLPNGYYLVKSQAFERNGANDYTGRDFKTGVEKINTTMIANDQSTKIKSLYSIPYSGANSLNGFADGTIAANALFDANSENFANYIVLYVNNGTLTFGLKKPNNSTVTSSNWICFDNFQIFGLGTEENSDMQSVSDKAISSPKSVLLAELKNDLLRINKGNRCNYLHENLLLPEKSPSGALYSYKVSGRGIDKAGKVKLSKKSQRALLKISLKQGNVRMDTVLSIKIAPDDNKTAYLFAHFCSNSFEGQQLRYAMTTKENPLLFKTILDGNSVVSGDTIASTKSIRDPHILRGNDGYFYMTMTDMDCNKGWWSNHAMVLMKSRNLVNWQHVSIDFKTKYPEWQMNGATAVWAPQTIWDAEYVNADGSKGRYMVYYGLFSAGKNTIHTYYSYVNDDFTDLLGTPVELMHNGIQNEDHIDADCIWSDIDSLYHMYYTHRGIKKKVSASLTANNWTSVNEGNSYNENFGEGSTICRLINSNSHLMLFDDQAGVYYYSFSHDNMNTFEKFARLDKSHLNPRHGTLLTLNKNEQELLQKWDELYQLMAKLTANPERESSELKLAISNAKTSLQMGWNTPITSLTEAIDTSIKLLEEYKSKD